MNQKINNISLTRNLTCVLKRLKAHNPMKRI